MSTEIVCQECGNPELDNLGSIQIGKYLYEKYICNGLDGKGCHYWIFKIDAETYELKVSSLSSCICCGENTFYKIGERKVNPGTDIFKYKCEGCGLTAEREFTPPDIDSVKYDLKGPLATEIPCIRCGDTVNELGEDAGNGGTSGSTYECKTCGLSAISEGNMLTYDLKAPLVKSVF